MRAVLKLVEAVIHAPLREQIFVRPHLDDPVHETVLARAPFDVAVLVGRVETARDGPVLVLF